MTHSPTPYATASALFKTLPLLGRVIGTRMRDSSDEDGTFAQIMVLMQYRDRPFTVSELAKRRKVSLQSASTLIQRLVDRGWIVRTPDPNDRRQTLLELTPEGMEHAQAVHEQFISNMAEVLEPLTSEELEAGEIFLAALQRILQVMPEETLER